MMWSPIVVTPAYAGVQKHKKNRNGNEKNCKNGGKEGR